MEFQNLELATFSFYKWINLGLERKMKSIILKKKLLRVYYEAGSVIQSE